jgi:hypothetical protein
MYLLLSRPGQEWEADVYEMGPHVDMGGGGSADRWASEGYGLPSKKAYHREVKASMSIRSRFDLGDLFNRIQKNLIISEGEPLVPLIEENKVSVEQAAAEMVAALNAERPSDEDIMALLASMSQ